MADRYPPRWLCLERHDALVRSNCGWFTEGHPSLEDETA